MIRPDIRLLDVGGTFIKCEDGRQVPIPSCGSREEIAAALKVAVGPFSSLKGVGVSIPGPFDYRNGIFRMKHKFAAVFGESFRELACLPSGLPVKYMHDVNAPLLGAVRMLGLSDVNVALVTLGTGLGFSYAVRGAVQTGEDGSPRLGLWNRPWNGGILEDRISARGIVAAYGEGASSALAVAQKAFAGDSCACRVYEETGALLGQALKPLADEIRLDVLLMGGQVSKSLELMLDPLRQALPGVKVQPAPEGAVFEGLESLF